jgi:hypothetical protein
MTTTPRPDKVVTVNTPTGAPHLAQIATDIEKQLLKQIISKSLSATSFFSLAFSCSSWRRRFTSTGSSFPKCLRQA